VHDIPAALFQTLVAFYFGRADWTHKHRLLRLWPVMALNTAADISPKTLAAQRRWPFQQSAVPGSVEEEAIRVALTLQAREWGERNLIEQPSFEYAHARRTLTIRNQPKGNILRRWSVQPDRSRLPL
jgi:hypothetical protein